MQQVQLLGGLGMIPSLQFSADPSINPNINPYLKMPEGMTQLTVQPTGEYRTSGEAQLQGLGARRRDHRAGGTCPAGCAPLSTGGCDCPYRSGNRLTFRGGGVSGLGVHMTAQAHKPAGVFTRHQLLQVNAGQNLRGIFDTAWWQNRKWLALGLVGVLGVGAVALATKILR